MQRYSIKKLANAAGVSVRTLHLYDQMGLLKPSIRSEKNYRLYGLQEALRLQQILLFKALGMPLKHIAVLLNNHQFDPISSLQSHKNLLHKKHEQIMIMLQTIDKTIDHLKNQTILMVEELYSGLPKEGFQKWLDTENQESHDSPMI